MTADVSEQIASVLSEIMGDHMISKMILLRDSGLWGAAVEALSAYEAGYDRRASRQPGQE